MLLSSLQSGDHPQRGRPACHSVLKPTSAFRTRTIRIATASTTSPVSQATVDWKGRLIRRADYTCKSHGQNAWSEIPVRTTILFPHDKFFPQLLGYYWAFPRTNHVSFGICGRLSQHPTREIKEYLHHFLEDAGYLSNMSETQHWQVYSALIPSLRRQSFCDNSVCGDGWALLGDAAGFVDPITCEGIYFALRSAELLAQALLEGRPLTYPDLCGEDFVADFIHAAELFNKFYTGKFLGSDFITRMVQTTSRSRTLRETMNAFVAGRQDYRTLRAHLIRKTPQILLQLATSVVR